MNILHIASMENNPCCGVAVVVPQHIIAQQKLADVVLLNLREGKYVGIENQYFYHNIFDLHKIFLKFGKPDLVVFHECYRSKYLLISLVLRKNHIPYIIVPHCELTVEAQNNKKSFKKKIANFLLFNHFINHALAIQCLSEKEMNSTLFGYKKYISTNGINLPFKYKKIFNEKIIKIVFIGRLDIYHKGLDLLLEAIKNKYDYLKNNSIKIYLYGPDYQGQYIEIEQLINSKNIQKIVRINHEVLSKEKEEILLEADVFIQTSRFEGMPMGILEALSYGLPCLVTRGTSLGELIEKYDAGWVCETNADSIAESIIRCINEKELFNVKGQNARKLIEENFTWNKVTRETINIYQKLAYKNIIRN